MPKPSLIFGSIAFLLTTSLNARDELNADQLKMLQDQGGWEYLAISDPDNGIQTQHTCFDGQPHPDQCRGTLRFYSSGTFNQSVFVHHQGIQRHGKYELNGNQLAFFDELGTKDGPYTVAINVQKKSMTLAMPQVRIELELEKEFRKQRSQSKN